MGKRGINKSRLKSKRGRPKTTGSGQPMVVRMHDRQLAAIDAWIVSQGEDISRPEAIRRLVEIGLRRKAND
jgi:hypothetical protein